MPARKLARFFLGAECIARKLVSLAYLGVKSRRDARGFVQGYTMPFWKFRINLCLDRDVDSRLYRDSFEFENRFIFSRCVMPGDVVIDVGANIGVYSLLAAARLGTAGAVYAFEPDTAVAVELTNNARMNGFGQVKIFHEAVSDSCGDLDFYKCQDPAYSSLNRNTMKDVAVRCRVRAISIDFFVQRERLKRVDVIKVDAEGADLSVLRGASHTLRDFRPYIFCEFNPHYLAGKSGLEFFQFLSAHDYRVASVSRAGLKFSFRLVERFGECPSELICFPREDRRMAEFL